MDRIGFDARMISHTGIGTYIRNLLFEYTRLGFSRFVSVYGDEAKMSGDVLEGAEFVDARFPVYSFSGQLYFKSRIKRNNRIFHAPHYNAPLLYRGKLVLTIHDLTHLKYPEFLPSAKAYFYARFMLRASSRKAARIITSSGSVKSDIIEYLGVPEDKIEVIPLAAGKEFCPVRDEAKLREFREKYNLPRDFILYAGNMKKHKNLDVLLEAYEKLRKKRGVEFSLVFATAGRPDSDLAEKAESMGLGAAVKFLPLIPDEEMPLLYNSASVFVFPSLSEGFGLPVLEALACGIPCVVSVQPSLTEVAGDAAVLCDPASRSDFEKGIYKVLSDSSGSEALSSRGLERAGRFSWEKTAGETINVYNICSGE